MNAEPQRVFVDSKVFVYAYDRSAGAKHERARTILEDLWRQHGGALSVQVLQEFFVTVTQKLHKPMGLSDARRIVVNLGTWRMHQPSAVDVVEAVDIHRDYKIAFWDAMIVRSASELGCDTLFTEDLNPGQMYRGVRAEDPFA